MKIKELREKSKEELNSLVDELRVKLGQLRFKLANRQVKNFRQLNLVKKDIARIQTILIENRNYE